ncbi:Bug family tripartite tricarboxylate transporter substrate binding protein [Halomonas sp. HK25]|uniref:Bug family tripartite tricarboxylate transporter substrate binding protein n=1 Tax=Halomonas sp. HK25 TaxID=3394321 RepID=UPI0039FDA55B
MNKKICGSIPVVLLAAIMSNHVMAKEAEFPDKPIRLVVPSTAGGGADVIARLYADRMSDLLDQPVVVENRPGASTMIGSRQVANAEPDGYTILIAANTLIAMPLISDDAGYAVEDFVGVTELGQTPMFVVSGSSSDFNTIYDLVDYAKENPGVVTYASGGYGTTAHIAAEMFSESSGVELLHIPYNGISNATPDVLSGRVDFLMASATTTINELVRSGDIRALATSSLARSPSYNDIPAFGELGYEGAEFTIFLGLFAPAGTPDYIREILAEAAGAAREDEELQRRKSAMGYSHSGINSPDEFDGFIRGENVRYHELMNRIGIAVK